MFPTHLSDLGRQMHLVGYGNAIMADGLLFLLILACIKLFLFFLNVVYGSK
jgi:hypothetical protein